MAKARFHFVDDYRRLVRDLVARHPLAEAMSLAVGGSHDALGEVEKQLLIGLGLAREHTLVDIGCGSGRLAHALRSYLAAGRYLGTDVVPELLDYARQGCPATWQFECVEGLHIPFPENCADFACFFSVFTHLLPEETYCYLAEAQRVVKPGGRIVFSFLEYADNWQIFKDTCDVIRDGRPNVHLNTFTGRDAIEAWTQRLGGMTIVEMRGAADPFVTLSRPIVYDDGRRVESKASLGQSLCVISNDKPAAAPRPRDRWSAASPYTVTYRHG